MEILLNANMIESLTSGESSLGTVIKLATGDEVLVKNSRGDIMQKIGAYRMGRAYVQKKGTKKKAASGKKKES